MTDRNDPAEKDARQRRFREAVRLHEIEGNPLSDEDKTLFQMFEREGWSDERARAHIIAEAQRRDLAKRTPQG